MVCRLSATAEVYIRFQASICGSVVDKVELRVTIFSEYFIFPCHYVSTNSLYPYLPVQPTLYNLEINSGLK